MDGGKPFRRGDSVLASRQKEGAKGVHKTVHILVLEAAPDLVVSGFSLRCGKCGRRGACNVALLHGKGNRGSR